MAHHKSAKKRIRSSERKRIYNQAAQSKVKTLTKKVLSSKDKTEVKKVYKEAVAALDSIFLAEREAASGLKRLRTEKYPDA